MNLWLAVAFGGALGALGRYGVSVALSPVTHKFPLATLTANVVGSFLIGMFYIAIVEKSLLAPAWRHVIMIGFLGAFTTFSTFSLETMNLLQASMWKTAVLYSVGSLLACLLAVFFGALLGERIFH